MTDWSSTSECSALADLVDAIRGCRLCVENPRGSVLPHEPRPVLRVSRTARLLVASQAPGVRVHASGTPFDDASGRRLRSWMAVSPEIFYDTRRIAIVPMGFCFPGHDRNKGDLPPRAECRALWHDRLMEAIPQIETILAIGLYAQRYHLARVGRAGRGMASLTQNVKNWREWAALRNPRIFVLPHPSWRNTAWLQRNPWFDSELLPELRDEVQRLVKSK